jgi:hypothetical protein
MARREEFLCGTFIRWRIEAATFQLYILGEFTVFHILSSTIYLETHMVFHAI